jgi:hypothetical protein
MCNSVRQSFTTSSLQPTLTTMLKSPTLAEHGKHVLENTGIWDKLCPLLSP